MTNRFGLQKIQLNVIDFRVFPLIGKKRVRAVRLETFGKLREVLLHNLLAAYVDQKSKVKKLSRKNVA